MEKASSLQIAEVLCRMLDFIGLPRALIDEASHGLRVRHIQAMRLLHFVEPLKLSVAVRDKMIPAEFLTVDHRVGSLLATLYSTGIGVHRFWNTH
jgi:hypothetical protein